MKKIVIAITLLCMANIGIATAAEKKPATPSRGEIRFKKLCAVCHPDGGNIVNPKKTLRKKDRLANNIKTEADIISRMRRPGPGMTVFSERAVPADEAQDIAGYILKTFK